MEPSRSAPEVVAVIDVGSSGIRMEIVEIRARGALHRVSSLHRSVMLGNDTFESGRLSQDALGDTCEALRNFKAAMVEAGVSRYRAVATHAVREAENCDLFVDQVHHRTGINLELVDGAEQNRLRYAAIRDSLGGVVDFGVDVVAVAEVGGGGADITVLDRGETVYADTFALGAIRIRKSIRHSPSGMKERNRFLHHMVRAAALGIPHSMPLDRATVFVALGGDVRFLAQQLRPEARHNARHWELGREEFIEGCRKTADVDPDRLTESYHLSFGDATTLGPALMIYEQIVRATAAERVIISGVSIRDGLLLDMVAQARGQGLQAFEEPIVASALGLARKYQVDEKHAMHVALLATELFDVVKAEHGLSPRERLLLRVAAVLHEVGVFVHNRSHHKHTLYLISASDIFGLSRREVEIVANVARYHRRSPPLATHPEYTKLERADRLVVAKLAAILRVADALDKPHQQKIRSLRCRPRNKELQILVPAEMDFLVEQFFLEEKSELFQEIYGLSPTIVPASV